MQFAFLCVSRKGRAGKKVTERIERSSNQRGTLCSPFVVRKCIGDWCIGVHRYQAHVEYRCDGATRACRRISMNRVGTRRHAAVTDSFSRLSHRPYSVCRHVNPLRITFRENVCNYIAVRRENANAFAIGRTAYSTIKYEYCMRENVHTRR